MGTSQVDTSQSLMFFFGNVSLWLSLHKKKIMINLIFYKYKHFLPIWDCGSAIFSQLSTIQAFGQNIWDKLWWYSREYLKCTFSEPLPSPHCSSKIYIPKYVHYHFWPRLLKELGYLLLFIFVSLIGCGASQSTNVFKVFKGFFLGGQWATPIGSSPKVLWNLPPH